MSRHQGRREAPKPVRQARMERLQRRGRPERVRPDPGEPITMARRWGAVATGSVMLLFAFAGVIGAIDASDLGDTAGARNALIVAVIIAPLAMYTLGLISRAPTPVRTVLITAPGAMAGFTLLSMLLREPATAVVAAFGIGGAFTLRLDPVHSVVRRISIVGVLAVLTLVTYRVLSTDVALIAAPLLPFAACAIADMVSERTSPAPAE